MINATVENPIIPIAVGKVWSIVWTVKREMFESTRVLVQRNVPERRAGLLTLGMWNVDNGIE